jgi:hypothetical protein
VDFKSGALGGECLVDEVSDGRSWRGSLLLDSKMALDRRSKQGVLRIQASTKLIGGIQVHSSETTL